MKGSDIPPGHFIELTNAHQLEIIDLYQVAISIASAGCLHIDHAIQCSDRAKNMPQDAQAIRLRTKHRRNVENAIEDAKSLYLKSSEIKSKLETAPKEYAWLKDSENIDIEGQQMPDVPSIEALLQINSCICHTANAIEANLEQHKKKNLKKYLEGSSKAYSHIGKLLNFAGQIVNRQNATYNPAPTSISDIINDSLAICCGTIDSSNIEIIIPEYSCNDLIFMGDMERSVAVLITVLSRMTKKIATQEQKYIRIDISEERFDNKKTGIIKIANNGPLLNCPFNDLFVYDKNGTKGIGLSICKSIIERRFYGSINATNINDEVVFTIALPLSKNHHSTNPPSQPSDNDSFYFGNT
jgi:signal transduction histidine kinase